MKANTKTKVTRSKPRKEMKVRPNKWGYGYVLYISLLTVGSSMILNTYLVSAKGEQPVEANYAFRETIRGTRRAKTLATYARKRGPMIQARLDGYAALSGPGVTHMEDAIGGLITGPLGLWRNGEVHVYEFQKGPTLTWTLKDLKMSSSHWTNGNADPCVDRQVYIGAQLVPQQTDATEYVELAIGFLTLDCTKTTQTGYLTKIKSLTHGGVLMARVYKITGDMRLEDFPANVTENNFEPTIQMEEIGSILEDREFTSSSHYQLLLGLFFAPMVLWFGMFIRLSGVKVTLSMAMTTGSASMASSGSNASTTSTRSDSSSSSTSSRGASMKSSRKEKVLTKYIDPRIVKLWRLPVIHLLYIFLYLVISQVKYDDEGIINDFIRQFDTIKIDYALHACALASQELTSWLLSGYSSAFTHKREKNVNATRALIYTYQHSEFRLFVLKGLNLALCGCLLVFSIDMLSIPETVQWVIIPILSVVIFVWELFMVLVGFRNHPFENIQACTIGGLSNGISIMTRQITSFLAAQEVKGLTQFNQNTNCVAGMEYVGNISDAIAMARPDYVMEGLINGEVIQVAVIEQSCKDNINFIKFTVVGNHQFQIVRHWLHQGKLSVALF